MLSYASASGAGHFHDCFATAQCRAVQFADDFVAYLRGHFDETMSFANRNSTRGAVAAGVSKGLLQGLWGSAVSTSNTDEQIHEASLIRTFVVAWTSVHSPRPTFTLSVGGFLRGRAAR